MKQHPRHIKIGSRALEMDVPEGHVFVAEHMAVYDIPGSDVRILPVNAGALWQLMTYDEYRRRATMPALAPLKSGELCLHMRYCSLRTRSHLERLGPPRDSYDLAQWEGAQLLSAFEADCTAMDARFDAEAKRKQEDFEAKRAQMRAAYHDRRAEMAARWKRY